MIGVVVQPDDPRLNELTLPVEFDRHLWHSVVLGLDDHSRHPLVGLVLQLLPCDDTQTVCHLAHLMFAPNRLVGWRVLELHEALRAHVRQLGFSAILIGVDRADQQAPYLRRILTHWHAELVQEDDDTDWYVREV